MCPDDACHLRGLVLLHYVTYEKRLCTFYGSVTLKPNNENEHLIIVPLRCILLLIETSAMTSQFVLLHYVNHIWSKLKFVLDPILKKEKERDFFFHKNEKEKFAHNQSEVLMKELTNFLSKNTYGWTLSIINV